MQSQPVVQHWASGVTCCMTLNKCLTMAAVCAAPPKQHAFLAQWSAIGQLQAPLCFRCTHSIVTTRPVQIDDPIKLPRCLRLGVACCERLQSHASGCCFGGILAALPELCPYCVLRDAGVACILLLLWQHLQALGYILRFCDSKVTFCQYFGRTQISWSGAAGQQAKNSWSCTTT